MLQYIATTQMPENTCFEMPDSEAKNEATQDVKEMLLGQFR